MVDYHVVLVQEVKGLKQQQVLVTCYNEGLNHRQRSRMNTKGAQHVESLGLKRSGTITVRYF